MEWPPNSPGTIGAIASLVFLGLPIQLCVERLGDFERRRESEQFGDALPSVGRAVARELADSKPVTSLRFGIVCPR